MTKKELIELLEPYPDDKEIKIGYSYFHIDIEDVFPYQYKTVYGDVIEDFIVINTDY